MAVDFTGLGFVLTAPDAAEILGRSGSEVYDLARAGALPFLAKSDAPHEPLRMWFHPDSVAYLEVRLRDSTQRNALAVDQRNRLRVQAALRAYLDAVPAERSYDTAMLNNAPLLSRTRQREEAINVRPEAVAAFGSTLDNVPVTVSMMTAALEYFGAVRVRGITALDEPNRQRWGVWYRLPTGFAAGDDDEPEVVAGMVGTAHEPGEQVRRRGMGAAYLSEPLRGVDDAAT